VIQAITTQFIITPSKKTLNILRVSLALEGLYRLATSSISVKISVRRHSFAKKNTVALNPQAADHHIQLLNIPVSREVPATQSGVSAAKVVATIDVPAMYQGSDLPATKKAEVLFEALFVK
jgi:hypothetical protein